MPEKKKILIIGPGMEIGGVEKSLLGLLDSIDYSRYDVDLFLYAHTGELMPYINKNVNILPENKLYALMKKPIFDLFLSGHFYVGCVRLFSKLYSGIRTVFTHTSSVNTTLCRKILTNHIKPFETKYAVAYSFFQPHYFVWKKVSADEKIGWVHTDYSNENEKEDTKFNFPMWNAMDKIACVSEDVKTVFDSIYPQLSKKTIVFENILPKDLIQKQSQEFSVENEMPNDGFFRILSIGRFCTAKNFDAIPEICSRLIYDGYKIKWYIIGYGPDEELIRKRIADFNIDKYVIILGKKTNPYPYISACDLYAQPSRYEGKAVTVCEAQLLKKPILITNYKTAHSQLKEGPMSHICDMGTNGIVSGIKYMLEQLI